MNYEILTTCFLIISACASGILVWVLFFKKLKNRNVQSGKKILAHFIGLIGGYFAATIIMVTAYAITIVFEGKDAPIGILGLGFSFLTTATLAWFVFFKKADICPPPVTYESD